MPRCRLRVAIRTFGLTLTLALGHALQADNRLELETRSALAGSAAVPLTVTLEHDLGGPAPDGLLGYNFGLVYDDNRLEALEVVIFESVGPPDFVSIDISETSAEIAVAVLYSNAPPFQTLPSGTYAVGEVNFGVLPAAPVGLGLVDFAAINGIDNQLGTLTGPPVLEPDLETVPGGVEVVSAFESVLTSPSRFLVPNRADNTLSLLDLSGALVTGPIAAPGSPAPTNPVALARDARNVTWVIYESASDGSGEGKLVRFGTDGALLDTFNIAAGPAGIVIDAFGNAWVSHMGSATLTEYAPSGLVLRGPGGLESGAVAVSEGPRSLAADQLGNVWVAAETSEELIRVNRAGAVVAAIALDSAPAEIATDPEGFVWVTLPGLDRVERRNSDGGLAETFELPGASPERLAIRASREAWVAAPGDARLYRLIPGQASLPIPVGPAPSGVTVDGASFVWVTDAVEANIRRFDLNGALSLGPIAIGLDPGFLGDPSGYRQASLFDPAADFDLDGILNSVEVEASTDLFDALSQPLPGSFTPAVTIEACESTPDTAEVQLAWSNRSPTYDAIRVLRDGLELASSPLPGDATSLSDNAPATGLFLYEVIAVEAGIESETRSCVAAIGPGTLVSSSLIELLEPAANLFDITKVNNPGPGEPAFLVNDSSGIIYATDAQFNPLNAIVSPFPENIPVGGVAFSSAGDSGQGSLFVASGANASNPALESVVLEVDRFGSVLSGPYMLMDTNGDRAGQVGGIYLDNITGTLLANFPPCDVLAFPLQGAPTGDVQAVQAASFQFPPIEGRGVALPFPGAYDLDGGVCLISQLNPDTCEPEVIEVSVSAGVATQTETPSIPLGDADGENSFGGFSFDDDLNELSVVGTTTSRILTFSAGVLFIRGDANFDQRVNLADPIEVLNFLLSIEPLGVCPVAYDANDDEEIDFLDAFLLLGYLFQAMAPPPAPFPGPGIDSTLGPLDCLGQ